MISFPAREERQEEVRSSRDIEVEGAFTIVMSKRIDQEGEVPDQDPRHEARPDQSIQPRFSVALQYDLTQ
jgi:hypothetical protein